MNKYNFITAILIFIIHTLAVNITALEISDSAFVTKLSIETTNNKILLKWINPDNFDNHISIYRSNTIIKTVNQLRKSTKIALLTNNEEKYIDTPNEHGDYYYAIMITRKDTGEDIKLFVPYRNYSVKPVTIKKTDFFQITQFNAISKKTYISLSWNYKKEAESSINIMLYRNTTPINNETELENATKIATIDIETQIYIDVPVADINYYYALFIEGDTDKKFTPGISTTDTPVTTEQYNELFENFMISDFIPLPLLAIKSDPKSGNMFIDPQILKNPKKIEYIPEVKKIIYDKKTKFNDIFIEYMKNKQNNLKLIEFKLLDSEEIFEPTEFQKEYQLAINYIKSNQFTIALKILEKLQEELIPQDYLKRISYYTGLIYYKDGNFYNAYINLILAYDLYPKTVSPYLTSIYLNIFNTLER